MLVPAGRVTAAARVIEPRAIAGRSAFSFVLTLYGQRGTWTYEEFHKLVRDHAVGLLGARFRPGDTIVLALDSSEPTERFLCHSLSSRPTPRSRVLASVVASLGSAFADLRIVYLDASCVSECECMACAPFVDPQRSHAQSR